MVMCLMQKRQLLKRLRAPAVSHFFVTHDFIHQPRAAAACSVQLGFCVSVRLPSEVGERKSDEARRKRQQAGDYVRTVYS